MPLEEAILSASLQVVFEKLASPILREFGFQWGIDRELRKLGGTLSKIQAVVSDAEQRQISDAAVRMWLDDLKDLAFDADDILDEFATEALRLRLEAENQENRNQAWSLGLKEGLGHTCFEEEGKEQTSSLVDTKSIHGRKQDKEKIIDLLLSDEPNRKNVSVICIAGMGGLGKTTLAQLVYNDEKVASHFDMKAWHSVSTDFHVRRCTRAVLECVTRKAYNLENLDPLQVSLKEISNKKRFLIVLDDIWNVDRNSWSQFQAPLYLAARGSIIVITTRNNKVSSVVGAIHIHHPEALPYEDCWSLFVQCTLSKSGVEAYPNLAESIGSLKHLRLLDVSRTWITRLPASVNNLYNLQTLVISECPNFQGLPNNIGNLINLRHLFLPTNCQVEHMPKGIRRLTCLQTLPIFVVDNKRLGIQDLRNFQHLRGSLCISKINNVKDALDAKEANLEHKQHLQELELQWDDEANGNFDGTVQENVLEYLQPSKKLKKLAIRSYGGRTLPTWMRHSSLPNLIVLSLHSCTRCKILPPLGQLPLLRQLNLSGKNGQSLMAMNFVNSKAFTSSIVPSSEPLLTDFPI